MNEQLIDQVSIQFPDWHREDIAYLLEELTSDWRTSTVASLFSDYYQQRILDRHV